MKTKNRLSSFLRPAMVTGILFFHALVNAETCISSVSDFNNNKSSFPPAFQSLPVMFTADNNAVMAGLKIRPAGDKIKLEGSVWSILKTYKDDSYVKKLCINGSNLKVTLDNGKSYNVKVNANSAIISGQEFKKTSAAAYSTIIQKIKVGTGEMSVKASASSGTK